MLRVLAILIFLFGVIVGVMFSEEIESVIEQESIDKMVEVVEQTRDFVVEKIEE